MRLIDADAFIERLKKDPLFPLVERYGLTSVIYTQKTVDPVKHGHWEDENMDEQVIARCSVCNTWDTMRTPYCPNCGAKMDEE